MPVKSRGTYNMTDRKEKVVGRKEGRKERMSHNSQEIGGSSADLRGRTQSAKPDSHTSHTSHNRDAIVSTYSVPTIGRRRHVGTLPTSEYKSPLPD